MSILFVLTGLLMIVLAVPMIRGKVPPNHWYGFRVRRTLEDPTGLVSGQCLCRESCCSIYGVVIIATAILYLAEMLADLTDESLAWVMTFVLVRRCFGPGSFELAISENAVDEQLQH